MISITVTPNLTGVTISGDVEDLRQLVDAFHLITVYETDKDYAQYSSMSHRVLGVCYDLRHASMGQRDAFLIENAMNRDLMKAHNLVTSESNVYFRCRVLLPEMMYVMLALNELVIRRAEILNKRKTRSYSLHQPAVIWDELIAIIRLFQAQFAKSMRAVLTEQGYNRWQKLMTKDYVYINSMVRQFLDVLNIDWLKWSREKRLKQLLKTADRLTDFHGDADHREILLVVEEGARLYGMPQSEVMLEGMDYPDEDTIEW
jgi:hypothetical protein